MNVKVSTFKPSKRGRKEYITNKWKRENVTSLINYYKNRISSEWGSKQRNSSSSSSSSKLWSNLLIGIGLVLIGLSFGS